MLPNAADVLIRDVSTLAAMRLLAEQANASGRFDAVIHNVAIGYREKRRIETADGLSQLWAVNVLVPYVLTALMRRPSRLVYLSSNRPTLSALTLAAASSGLSGTTAASDDDRRH